MKLQIAVLLTMSIFLTACSQTPTGNAGFSVVKYSQEQRKAVYNEMTINKTYPSCPAPVQTIEMLKDYKVLRDQARVK